MPIDEIYQYYLQGIQYILIVKEKKVISKKTLIGLGTLGIV
jgi:hypothetical protein